MRRFLIGCLLGFCCITGCQSQSSGPPFKAVPGPIIASEGAGTEQAARPQTAAKNVASGKGPAPAKNAVTFKRASTVQLSNLAYDISPPAGWTVEDPRLLPLPPQTEFFMHGPTVDGFANTFSVVKVPSASGETLENALPQIGPTLKETLANYQQREQKYVMLGGQPAIYNACYAQNGSPLKDVWMAHVFVIRGGDTYTFAGTALQSNYKSAIPTFNAIFDSVKWK